MIKILEKETALALERRGFSYVVEKIDETQNAYAFENTEALRAVLNEEYGSVEFFESDMLRF